MTKHSLVVKEKIDITRDLTEDLKEMNLKKEIFKQRKLKTLMTRKEVNSRNNRSITVHVMCVVKWVNRQETIDIEIIVQGNITTSK